MVSFMFAFLYNLIFVTIVAAATTIFICFILKYFDREKKRNTSLEISQVMALCALLLFAILNTIDKPVPGESEQESFILSQYIEEGKYQPYYLKYDRELDQYKFCCFDNTGKIIGLTAPVSSRFIPIDPRQDINVAPYHVDIYSTEVIRRFSGAEVTHAIQMVFYVPEENAYFYDIN
ncbi:hypothetical protein IJH16_01885 [Candidatus Saccharibacteria bacterium]|nr:hypothetical protein [Candidatus Saccharibacteria bacterium]